VARVAGKMRPLIAGIIEDRGWTGIAAAEWQALREAFPATSEDTLRRHLQALEAAVEQPWRGIDTKSLDALEASLKEMAAVYPALPRETRAVVIAAKDKTRFASRNRKAAAEKRAMKLEMVEWMLVWLGDPAMFAAWAGLRRGFLEVSPAKPIRP
jgi:hypothetical protein